MKNAFRSASSIHHKKVLVLKKSLDYITGRTLQTDNEIAMRKFYAAANAIM